MSYQTASDRVEALRNIRGGRLTKWKGIVASCAPTMGVVALAISTLGVAGAANAANECTAGVAPAAGATVICTTANYNPADGDIVYSNVDGLTLQLNDPALNVSSATTAVAATGAATSTTPITINATSFGTITTTGTNGIGLNAFVTNASSTAASTITLSGGTIATSGQSAFGVDARMAGLGAATTKMDGGAIITAGTSSYGLRSSVSNSTSAAVVTSLMSGGSIETSGQSAIAVYAQTTGLGATIAQMEGGDIKTLGVGAQGLRSDIANTSNTATSTALMTAGNITTVSNSASGVFAQTTGLGATIAQMDGGTVTTGGTSAHGLYSNITNTSSTATATALLTGGAVETAGNIGYGVYAVNLGNGAATATMNGGSVDTAGILAHGVYSYTSNATNAETSTALMISGDITATGSGYALFARSSGLGDTLAQMDGGTATTIGGAGLYAHGVASLIDNSASSATATALLTSGDVITQGGIGSGLYARNLGLGDVRAQMDGGTVTTGGVGARGLYSMIENIASNATATARLTSGVIKTSGVSGIGVYARTSGLGATLAQMDGGTVTTSGESASGMFSQINNAANTATATALLTAGDIVTTADNARGIYALTNGLGATLAQMDGGTVTTGGTSAHGLYSTITNASSTATSTATMTSGTVATTGLNATGVFATTAGTGLATATVAGDAVVKAGGVDSDGIRALISQAAATYAVAVDGTASVTGGFGTGAGIHTVSVAGSTGTVTVGANAVVDGSRGAAGIVDDAGNTTMAINGKLLGGISAGAGNDVANLNAGSTITGSVAMGDGSDVVSIAAGADVSGLTLLDGGDDLTAGDGFIDVLSVDGLSGAVDGSIITNWEEINVANSDVQVTDLVAGAVSVTASTVVATNLTADKVSLTNSTTTIGGTSVVATVNTCGGSTTLTGSTATTDVKGCASADTIVISGDAVIANAIEGAGGADTISVLGNASVASVNGAGAGSDGSAAADAGNTILVNTTGTVGTVLGGDQADAITLTAGTVGTVVAGGGADTIIANGADVTTSIDAGDGDDTVTWSAGTVAAIATGLGSDALVVSASEYDGSQVLDGGDDLSTADGMVDTLTFKDLTVAATGANVTNWENVVIDGGTVSFSDNALTTGSDAGTGLSIVNGGALDAGDAFALTGNLTVNAGSTFDGTGAGAGVYSISGNLANNGIVTTKDGVVGDTITVAGNYSGTGILSVDIDTATDTMDTLVIAGDVTGGPTTVVVNNLSPLGASGNALTVIAVGGTSAAGDFVLDGGSLTAGAFDYNLAHQGSNFVLASAVNSTGAVYQAAPSVLSGLNSLPTLEQRVGQRQWAGTNVARGELQPSTGGWLRLRGDKLKSSNTTGVNADTSTWGLQAGIDYNVETGGEGQWVLGVTGQYGKLGSTITNPLGFGKIDAEGFGIGATATWYGTKGTYVDLQGQMNWISSDFSSSAAGSLAQGELSKAYALSAEVGHRFELDQNTTLVPQAQLTFGKIQGASFTDSAGNAVDLGSNTSMIGRLGLAYEYENNDRTDGNRTKAYVIGNILHDFSKDSMVNVAGADLSSANSGKTWGEIGIGGSVTIDSNKTIFGEASYRGSFNGGSNSGLGLTAGLRVQW